MGQSMRHSENAMPREHLTPGQDVPVPRRHLALRFGVRCTAVQTLTWLLFIELVAGEGEDGKGAPLQLLLQLN